MGIQGPMARDDIGSVGYMTWVDNGVSSWMRRHAAGKAPEHGSPTLSCGHLFSATLTFLRELVDSVCRKLPGR